ncbi:MAG: RnfABCDGE type electron transport complex subunit D [Clostridia bacterium]|nr:RnfABCDGE type electron transport complex subunit D [Clostridia bacterium]
MSQLHVSASPHIHSGNSTSGIMRDVLIALLPTTLAGVIIFGWRALLVLLVSVGSAVGFEALWQWLLKKDQTITDLSAAVTGLLLGLNLPANIPLWQVVIGNLFAIIVVKCLFGGLGCNLVNPAITGRVFMLVSFGSLVKNAFPVGVDATTSATPLGTLAAGGTVSYADLFLGNVGGAIGETCKLALLIGFVYLLVRRVITWHLPVVFIASSFVLTFLFNGFDLNAAALMTLSGGLFIGAIFMATDYVTSPATAWGKVVFAVGAALITVMVRLWGNYPEGVSYGILLMNILTPYIETWTRHKRFGEVKKA